MAAVHPKDWRQALERTRRSAFGRVATLFGATEIDGDYWERLEAGLIQADVGADRVGAWVERMRRRAVELGWTRGEQIEDKLESLLLDTLRPASAVARGHPHVVLLVGVNGSGKTTTVARLGHRYQAAGKQVVLAAADTYRAAAAEQLQRWGERLRCEVVSGDPGSDPGAVLYRACEIARGADVLLADTSGRMHTSHNLMAELGKLGRVAGKVIEGAPHEVLLVLDATTGQNGLAQARAFAEAIPLTGVVLAKLDSSAHGGVAFAVAEELRVPILYAGVGESLQDLEPFDPDAFVNALLREPQSQASR